MSLLNRVALVTGGNSGIGLATAKELILQGAKVIITERRKEVVDQVASEIGAHVFITDQSKVDEIASLATAVEGQFGKIDILFVNAGITGAPSLVVDATEENFDAVMDINFKGAYFTLSKFVPLLSEGASVVFLSSNTALMTQPQSSIYQASKAALNSIAKTAAAELAPKKIRVNTISPGQLDLLAFIVATGLPRSIKSGLDLLKIEGGYLRAPLKELSVPEIDKLRKILDSTIGDAS